MNSHNRYESQKFVSNVFNRFKYGVDYVLDDDEVIDDDDATIIGISNYKNKIDS